VVDHLGVELQQVEIDEHVAVLAAAHLRLHTIHQPRPVEVLPPLAEERATMLVAHELEQLAVERDPRERRCRKLRLRVVIDVPPGRHAGMHVQVGGRGAVVPKRRAISGVFAFAYGIVRVALKPQLWTFVPG